MNGTKRYQQRFGERLLYVRPQRPGKTAPPDHRRAYRRWIPLASLPHRTEKRLFPHPNQNVLARIDYAESELRNQAKAAGHSGCLNW